MLTDSKIRAAKPTGKPYKLTDSNRLYLHVSAIGTKTFRLDYTLAGKFKTIVIGNYPDVTLSEARETASEYRKQSKRGVDPKIRTSKKYAFQAIAEEYRKLKEWDDKHKQTRRLILYVYPSIGAANINDLEPPTILEVIRPIERQGTGETAHRVLNLIGQVYRYAVRCGYTPYDRTQGLSGALRPVKGANFRAITDGEKIKQAYKELDNIFSVVTRNALKMAALTAARPGEVRAMRWVDIDLDKKVWAYFVTKTQTDHIVPLSTQAVAILKEMQSYTGSEKHVFISLRSSDKDRPLSNTAMLMALQRIGIETTVHGFRASFRTICSEVLDIPDHLLEHQLAHKVSDPHGNAYNRTKHLAKRAEIMQMWSDYLTRQ